MHSGRRKVTNEILKRDQIPSRARTVEWKCSQVIAVSRAHVFPSTKAFCGLLSLSYEGGSHFSRRSQQFPFKNAKFEGQRVLAELATRKITYADI